MTKKTGKTRKERKAAQAKLQGSHTESQVPAHTDGFPRLRSVMAFTAPRPAPRPPPQQASLQAFRARMQVFQTESQFPRPQPEQVPLPEGELDAESEAETEYSYLSNDAELAADIQEIITDLRSRRKKENHEENCSCYETLYPWCPKLLQDTDAPLHSNTELELEGEPDLESLDEVKSEAPPATIDGNGQSPTSAQTPGHSSEESHACETSRYLQPMENPDSALSLAENREHQSDVPQSAEEVARDEVESSDMVLGWEHRSLDSLFKDTRAKAANRAKSMGLFQTRQPLNYKPRGASPTEAQILERKTIIKSIRTQIDTQIGISGTVYLTLMELMSLLKKVPLPLAEELVNALPHPLGSYCASKSLKPYGPDKNPVGDESTGASNNDSSESDLFSDTLCRMLGLRPPKNIRPMCLLVPYGEKWDSPHDRALRIQLRERKQVHPWFIWNLIHEARWRFAKFDKDDSPWLGLQTPRHTFKALDEHLSRFWTIEYGLGTSLVRFPRHPDMLFEAMAAHFARGLKLGLGKDLSNFYCDPEMVDYVKQHTGVEIDLPETAAMGDAALLLAKFKQILLLGKRCEIPYGIYTVSLKGTGGNPGERQTWVYKNYHLSKQCLSIDDQSGLRTEIDSKSQFLPHNQHREAEVQTDKENRAKFRKQNEKPSLKATTELSRNERRNYYSQAPLEPIQVSEDVVKPFDAQALLDTVTGLAGAMEKYLLDRSLTQIRNVYGLDCAMKLFNDLRTRPHATPIQITHYDATFLPVEPRPEDDFTLRPNPKPVRFLPPDQRGYPSLLPLYATGKVPPPRSEWSYQPDMPLENPFTHPDDDDDPPIRSSTPDSEASTIRLAGTTVVGTPSHRSQISEDTPQPPLRNLLTSPTRQEIPRGRVSTLARDYETMLRSMPRRRSKSRDLEPVPAGDMFGRSRIMARWNQRRKRSFERRPERM